MVLPLLAGLITRWGLLWSERRAECAEEVRLGWIKEVEDEWTVDATLPVGNKMIKGG